MLNPTLVLDHVAATIDEARRLPAREFLALQLMRLAYVLHDTDFDDALLHARHRCTGQAR